MPHALGAWKLSSASSANSASPGPSPNQTSFRASLFRRLFFLNFSLNARLFTAAWSPLGEATWCASRRASDMSRGDRTARAPRALT